jgi:cation diffusion facilitator family transporter
MLSAVRTDALQKRKPHLHWIAFGSIGISLLVLALKYAAYLLTGSLALYSDALESIINVVASGVALLALRIGARPADARYPYGYHKAEYFSAVLEGVLIAGAAFLILREASQAVFDPKPIEAPALGLAVNAFGSLLNAGWAFLLIQEGKRHHSPALEADGHHLFSDVVTSCGVLVGVALTFLTGRAILDPLIAALVAFYILWAGWRLIKGSVSSLMDSAISAEELERIKAAVSEHGLGALEAHDLRTRSAGRMIFVDFHLVVPGDMSVAEAHAICDRLEDAICAEVKTAHVAIHVEPENQAKRKGIMVL